MSGSKVVLILGAGINGCAIARELALNGVGVCLVDTADIASGATAYSSRLIHGGLRYLEYGEFDLVRESLAERTRLLRLAPQFVRPLKLSIPVSSRVSGFFDAAKRFLGWGRAATPSQSRGMWIVRLGLWLYDRYARDPSLPGHAVRRVGAPGTSPVGGAYRWLCDYWDAQIVYPERFVLALLADAELAAKEKNVPFKVYTYHEARLSDGRIELLPVGVARSESAKGVRQGASLVATLSPDVIINATGASVDRTLARLKISSPPLMGPTKGSHFVTFQSALRAAIGDQGVYAEAADGRPVFVLPLGEGVLVGTTDIPFDEPPESAVATTDELNYLLAAVNQVFPQVHLDRSDIDFHYAGVRPLPRVEAAAPAGITRRHWLAETPDAPIPTYSVIGGKLTTCRSLAEQAADTVLSRLNVSRVAHTRDRGLVPKLELGNENGAPHDNLDGTSLPRELACWMIRHEHARTLGDLVERRLMLLYHPRLTRRCLDQLAQVLLEEGMIDDAPAHVEQTIDRLARHYGKRVHISPVPSP